MRRHALLVYNPSAGTAQDADLWLGPVVHQLGNEYTVTILATEADMQPDAIFNVIDNQLDLVVAAGGDGTLRFALGAVASRKSDIPVGLIPLGTGNQLARNLGIYEENLLFDPIESALKVILNGEPMRIDLGLMNGEYFCVAAGAGPLSDAVLLPESKDKVNWKVLAYASSLLQTFALPPIVFRITIGEESFQVAASGVFVTNIADLGLGRLSDTAEINDGLLDLCILNPKEFEDYMEAGFHMAGGLPGSEAPYFIRKITSMSIEVVPIRSRLSRFQHLTHRVRSFFKGDSQSRPPVKQEVTAMIDGDAWGTTPMNIEVAPHAVNVLIPAARVRNGNLA